jgi:hypothetical protein
MTEDRKATLLLTHSTPDLDAIGFVYSARKVFGAGTPVACRMPTRQELEDPAISVGDIGLPGCEAIGYSPTLNNYDHHYSYADRSATYLCNQTYDALRPDIVAYIDAVDLVGGQEEAEATLKAATVGVRVRHAGDDLAVLMQGGRLLRWLEETDTLPGDLSGPCRQTSRTTCGAARRSCVGSAQSCWPCSGPRRAAAAPRVTWSAHHRWFRA